MRAAVIYNPYAGRNHGERAAWTVEGYLLAHGLDVDLYATGESGDATRFAAEASASADIVVAVGGDGTVNEVINGMATGGATLGIVPAGTVNVLALELGIPFQVEKACEILANGKTLAMDLGRVNERRFVLMMGAGIDALTILNIDPKAKKRFREFAFVSTGLRQGFARPPQPFFVRVNGEEHRATFLVAGNSRYYGGRFGLTTDADPTDGLLDVLMFKGTTVASLGVFWLGVPTGLHLHHRDVTYVRAERAEVLPVDEEHVVWYQTDGELAGRLPANLGIDHHAIKILVP
jgi:YegS/Rv2252/BmrU family lipid kinase